MKITKCSSIIELVHDDETWWYFVHSGNIRHICSGFTSTGAIEYVKDADEWWCKRCRASLSKNLRNMIHLYQLDS